MLVNIIQNTIGVFQNLLGIITNGLKMFLPFSSSLLNTNGQFSLDETTNNNDAKLLTGNCLDFDGGNDYVDAGNPNISLKTLVFWINLDSTTEQVMTLTSSQSILISSGTITLNGTWSGSVIYVDNVVTSTISASSYKRVVITTTSAITVNDLEFGRIGSDYGGFKMSDVQIWNSTWSATDVANDYAKPNEVVSSVSVSNLKGYWAMTEGNGGIAYDSSGEGNNGTINGASWLPAQSTIPQLGMMDWSKGSNLLTYSEDFTEYTANGNTVTGGFISPLGDASAYKISGTVALFIASPLGSTTGFTRSIYARTVSGTGTANLLTYYGNGDVFNLTETWQRFEVTGWGTTGASTFYGTDFRGTGNLSELLIWGAQEVAGTSAGNYRKTNGTAVTNAILPPYPVNPTTDVLGNLLRQRLNSLNLTGTGVAEVADSASINPSAITVQCWIFSNTQNAKGLVAKWGNGLLDYMLFKTTNNFRFYIGSSNKASGTIPNTGWVNIAGTYDGSNMKTFINGTLSTTKAETGAIPNNTNVLEIGRYGSNPTHSYSERIDDVKLYDRALTADEILQNYKAGLSAHTN